MNILKKTILCIMLIGLFALTSCELDTPKNETPGDNTTQTPADEVIQTPNDNTTQTPADEVTQIPNDELLQAPKPVVINNDYDRILYHLKCYEVDSYYNATTMVKKNLDNTIKNAETIYNKITANEASYLFGYSMTKTEHMKNIYGNVVKLGKAYSVHGGKYYKDQELLSKIKSILTYMEENYYSKRYNISFPENDNWYDWCITIPLYLLKSLNFIKDDLTEDELTYYLKSFKQYVVDSGSYSYQTMANQAEWGMNLILYGAFTRNDELISETYASLEKIFIRSTSGDGFREDGSFIQHIIHPYTGAYGATMVCNLAKISLYLSNTKFSSNEYDEKLYNIVLDAYIPLMYEGKVQTMVCGRHAYTNMQSVDTGSRIAQTLAIMSSYLPKEKSDYFKRYLKTFTTQHLENLVSELFVIKTIDSAKDLPELVIDNYTRVYNGMNKACGYYNSIGYGISMSSNEIAKYEAINGNNPRGWYQGDGATYIYTKTSDYDRNYYKTVNMYRLAGTTVTTAIRSEASISVMETLNTDSRYLGGVTSGNDMITGMHLSGHLNSYFSTTLTANKGYYLSEGVLVCFGENINCSDAGEDTLTIIENRRFTGDIYFGDVKVDLNVKSGDVTSNYIYIENYGTIFVKDINGLKYNITNNGYIELFINHGNNIVDASYYYILIPNVELDNANNVVSDFTYSYSNDKSIITRKSNNSIATINWNGTVELQAQ